HEVDADMGRQDRYDGDVGLWPQLTSEPDRGIAGADAVQHESFTARRTRQSGAVADNANAACRAACPAATDAGVRDLEPQARFQDAQALRYADLFVRIGNRDHAAPTLAQAAHAARHEYQRQRGGIADRKVKQRDLVNNGALRRWHRFDVL